MNIHFTGLFPLWQCHFVAECNFMEEHIQKGDKISLTECNSALSACDANPTVHLPVCLTCISIRESAKKLLSEEVETFPLVDENIKKTIVSNIKIPHFKNREELDSFTWRGIKVGKEVVSSVVTATGQQNFSVSKNCKLLKKNINDYIGVYFTALDIIENKKISLVYIFNGRFTASRAWLRACEYTNTKYVTHDRIGMPDRMLKIENGSPHDLGMYGKLISTFWKKNRNDNNVVNHAHDFFKERPSGSLTGWYSFVKNQNAGQLPANWDPEKRNIVIFSSTESEFFGLPELFVGALFSNQATAYKTVCEITNDTKDIHYFLRIHPNSIYENEKWWTTENLNGLKNLTIIQPESPISSYSLLMAAEKCIVFMSTMGIEATYWGKPSIAISNTMYQGLSAVYEPADITHLKNLILDPGLDPKPSINALGYGAYMRCGNAPLPYSQAIDHCTLTFKGIRPNASEKVLNHLWKWNFLKNNLSIPMWIKKIWAGIEYFRLSREL
jgi:hypothetical protein